MRLFFGKDLRFPIINAFKEVSNYLCRVFDIRSVKLSEYESLTDDGLFREGTLYTTTDQAYDGCEEIYSVTLALRAGYYEGREVKSGMLNNKLVFKYSDPPSPPTPAIDPTKIAIFPLDDITYERLSDTPMYADNYLTFRDITRDDVKNHFELDHVNYVEVIFGDLCGVTNSDIEIVYEGLAPSPSTPEPKLATNIRKLILNEGITRLVSFDDKISFLSNDSSLKYLSIPSTVTFITYNSGEGYNVFNTYLANPDVITINKPSGSISGAPWGAENADVIWTG